MNPVNELVSWALPASVGPAGQSMPESWPAGAFPKPSATGPARATSVAILSTYPPTQCGLATFTMSLRAGLIADEPTLSVGVVRVGSAPRSTHDRDVTHVLSSDTSAETQDAALALNKFDVAIIQHEYGIYGGVDGDQVLGILEEVRVPVLLVAHTVLAHPTPHQRFILEMLTQAADSVVTMSEMGRRRLLDDYRVEPLKLKLIPHGAPVADPVRRTAKAGRRPTILTWGLLGPNKGIEWGIAALSSMSGLDPSPRYVVAGQTHPKVLAREGERYRDYLVDWAERQGVADLVEFEPGYLSTVRLRELLRDADVVLLPYNSHEQVTSGVLTEAMAAGVPVVSTAFPHAVELLADGRGGLLVPHEDPPAIAAALTRIIAEPGLAQAMSTHNAGRTDLVNWPTVASRYRVLLNTLSRCATVSSR